ncbi:hypothetical protein [Kamptonema sp. UHCC 0994]|uniref:hypothetical protein n=1 Tax=Kamptonema sp. UHCC 0994 TaxID=3031329 RepID=UPI0023B9717E|nr:hypothetical protein [Kamptonema sp. UHCC 0994]MDF0554549.1 hypothetical protein [Kamptonema sp. UHCC 0994]
MVKSSNNIENSRILAYLTVLLPISFGVVATLESWRFLLAIAVMGGFGWAWKRYQRQQQHKLAHLDAVFYQLIQENKGRVTVLDLAMNAKFSGTQVQQYLDERAKEFAAEFEITEQGGIIYYFQTAQSLNKSEEYDFVGDLHLTVDPPLQDAMNLSDRAIIKDLSITPVEVRNQQEEKRKSPELFPLSQGKEVEKSKLLLTQVELANRLNVHPTTVSKWKVKTEFSEWSYQKDPEAIAWQYCRENKRFFPKS